MELHKDLPVIVYKTYDQWLKWLEKNHTQTSGIWVKFAKKGTGVTTITYVEAREGAIIYGWIDGLANKYDETYYLVRFTPRRPKGVWSQINRDIVEELTKAGKMKPTGLAQVDAAKADGRWDAAYAGQGSMEVPDDLQKELDKSPTLTEAFAQLNKTNRYAFLYRIHTAHKPELRAKRIAKTIEMLENGKRYHG